MAAWSQASLELQGLELEVGMQVEVYVIFGIDAGADKAATIEKLRSTSLQNCLQLIVGDHFNDVFVHIAGSGDADVYTAVAQLSAVKGVSRVDNNLTVKKT